MTAGTAPAAVATTKGEDDEVWDPFPLAFSLVLRLPFLLLFLLLALVRLIVSVVLVPAVLAESPWWGRVHTKVLFLFLVVSLA